MTLQILIVDDDQAKIREVTRALGQSGIGESDITVANDCVAARNLLNARAFDLAIFDLRLPVRPGAQPSADAGLNLVKSIHEEDALKRPSYIVGLTGFADLAEEFAAEFQALVWSVIIFEFGVSKWEDQLGTLVTHVSAVCDEAGRAVRRADVCIVTALREIEHQAIMDNGWAWSDVPEPLDENHYVRSGALTTGERRISIAAAHTHRPGMVPTALLVTKLIARYRPAIMLMSGICAGRQDATEIGDPIVGTSSWDWQAGKLRAELGRSVLAPELDLISAPRSLISRLELVTDEQLANIALSWRGARPPTMPKLRFGPMACGSSVVTAQETMEQIESQNRKVVGLDMESYGFYCAATYSSQPSPVFAAIKVATDKADATKNDEYQRYGAFLSARIIDLFLRSQLTGLL